MGKTLDDGVDLGKVTSTLEKIGVQVVDGDGKMRGVGNIMEDLMKVWDSIDATQKAAVGQTLAGKFQLTRFEALMNRSDLYKQYKAGSENASGTLDVMNEKYVDSLQGKLNKLQTTFEGIINSLGNSSDFYGFIDGLSTALDLMQKLIDSIGGGSAALTLFGATASRVFSKQIAHGLTAMAQNFSLGQIKENNAKVRKEKLNAMGYQKIDDKSLDPLKNMIDVGTNYQSVMSNEQQTQYNKLLVDTSHAINGVTDAEAKLREAVNETNMAIGAATGEYKEYIQLLRDENGVLQAKGTQEYYNNVNAGREELYKNISSKEAKQRLQGIANESSGISSVTIPKHRDKIAALGADSNPMKIMTDGRASLKFILKDSQRLLKAYGITESIYGKDSIFAYLDKQATDCLEPIDKVIQALRKLSPLANSTVRKNGLNSDNLGEAIGLIDTLQSSMNEVNQGAEGA